MSPVLTWTLTWLTLTAVFLKTMHFPYWENLRMLWSFMNSNRKQFPKKRKLFFFLLSKFLFNVRDDFHHTATWFSLNWFFFFLKLNFCSIFIEKDNEQATMIGRLYNLRMILIKKSRCQFMIDFFYLTDEQFFHLIRF